MAALMPRTTQAMRPAWRSSPPGTLARRQIIDGVLPGGDLGYRTMDEQLPWGTEDQRPDRPEAAAKEVLEPAMGLGRPWEALTSPTVQSPSPSSSPPVTLGDGEQLRNPQPEPPLSARSMWSDGRTQGCLQVRREIEVRVPWRASYRLASSGPSAVAVMASIHSATSVQIEKAGAFQCSSSEGDLSTRVFCERQRLLATSIAVGGLPALLS